MREDKEERSFPSKLVFLVVVCVVVLVGTYSRYRTNTVPHQSEFQATSDNSESVTSWELRALAIQTEIDNTAVLSQTFWAGCHNAFANKNDARGIIDPNQKLSIKSQLEGGVREFSLDVYKPKTRKNIRVCHGKCTPATGDLSFSSVLDKYAKFIAKNRRAVILLKLEVGQSAENNRQKVAKDIRDKIGEYVYQTGSTQRAGVSLPAASLTKQQILNAGKNVIVLVFNHVKTNENSELFNQYVFYKGDEVDDVGKPEKIPVDGTELGIMYRVKMGETKKGLLGGEITPKKIFQKGVHKLKQGYKSAKKGAKKVFNKAKKGAKKTANKAKKGVKKTANKAKKGAKKLFGKKKKKKKKGKKRRRLTAKKTVKVSQEKRLLAPLKVSRSNIDEWLSAGVNIVELYGFNADGSDWWHAGTKPVLARDLVWSWDEASREPKLNSRNSVALLESTTNRFRTGASRSWARCACKKSDGTWGITQRNLRLGNRIRVIRYITLQCVREFGYGAKFASPMYKVDLDALVEARDYNYETSDIGLNYVKTRGNWVANA